MSLIVSRFGFRVIKASCQKANSKPETQNSKLLLDYHINLMKNRLLFPRHLLSGMFMLLAGLTFAFVLTACGQTTADPANTGDAAAPAADASAAHTPASNTPQQKVVNKPKAKAEGAVNWVSFEEAEALMAKEPRKIMVDVYTKWCGPCKRMNSQTFGNPTLAKYINENYYAVKFDAESPRSDHLPR